MTPETKFKCAVRRAEKEGSARFFTSFHSARRRVRVNFAVIVRDGLLIINTPGAELRKIPFAMIPADPEMRMAFLRYEWRSIWQDFKILRSKPRA
jgi:hypothetical protein